MKTITLPESTDAATLARILIEEMQGGVVCLMDPTWTYAVRGLGALREAGVRIDRVLVSCPDNAEMQTEITDALRRSTAVDTIVVIELAVAEAA
jgi:RecA/RadA recombinase